MGLFGVLGSITGAAVKIAATPVAVLSDIASVAVTGESSDHTKNLIKSAGEDIDEIFDDF